LIRRLERRALAKLRDRFEEQATWAPVAPDLEDDSSANLKVGGTRFCLREHGSLDDPLPVLFLPPAGLSARFFAPALARAAALGRRAIGVDLPGFGGSRRKVQTLEPARVAEQLEALLDALRVRRVDLVGAGFGARVGRALAARAGRVRRWSRSMPLTPRETRRLRRSPRSEALRATLAAALLGMARASWRASTENLARSPESWPTPPVASRCAAARRRARPDRSGAPRDVSTS
jgi:pimeloyl-ACP methyl ester carboxylesterase